MTPIRSARLLLLTTACAALAGCGGGLSSGSSSATSSQIASADGDGLENPASIWDVLRRPDANTNVHVNKYIWNASLDVLSFLPVESVDPFSGVITTGYGRPPGGGRAYRATILVNDVALEARSLNVALQTRNGPVSVGTARAVEDAILARARQLRIADGRL
jgi:hypothetical protein